jgi:hypothetical protein
MNNLRGAEERYRELHRLQPTQSDVEKQTLPYNTALAKIELDASTIWIIGSKQVNNLTAALITNEHEINQTLGVDAAGAQFKGTPFESLLATYNKAGGAVKKSDDYFPQFTQAARVDMGAGD